MERRKLNEYNLFNIEYSYRHFNDMDPTLHGYDALLSLKVKELDDVDEMIIAIEANNFDKVKNIFERDNIKIPFRIKHSSYSRQTGYGYELKYERALDLACELGREEIVKYLYENNVCCENIMYKLRKTNNDEFKECIRKKEEINENLWKINQVKHYQSVPVKDERCIRDVDNVYNQINMYKAVIQNNIEGVKYVFKRSKENPRKIGGYNESHYDSTYSLCLLKAAKLGHLEILKYLLDNKVAYEHLHLLNVVSPEYIPGKFKFPKNECINEMKLNTGITYTPVELLLVKHEVYYDNYDNYISRSRFYNSTFKEKEKLSIATDEIFLKYTTDELKNNINILMKAVENNDIPTAKNILSIGPPQAPGIYVESYWNYYTLKYDKCYEKSTKLKTTDIFKLFLDNDMYFWDIKLTGEFKEIFEKYRIGKNLV